MNLKYIQHTGKVIETNSTYPLVMAIALDPRTKYKEGVLRCITHREGDVMIKGYKDKSELHKVTGDSLEHFSISERIKIKGEDEMIASLMKEGLEFIGLEDPDIWIDEKTDLLHLYFTIPLLSIKKIENQLKGVHLGHAVGKDLDSLVMTDPVLLTDSKGQYAKELSISPINSKGFRYNLVESCIREGDTRYSTVRIAKALDMGSKWEFGQTVLHPKEWNISWIAGHASPGPLFPYTFIDIGKNKRVGIVNGREKNKVVNGIILYGMFSVGLFIYDFEEGKIDWVSPEPFIQDSEAKTITFASQFVETNKGEGILYAHVDDSFVRAYTLKAEDIKGLLPL
jgi:hypothetical protein